MPASMEESDTRNMATRSRRWLLLAIAGGGALALDQGAKALVMSHLALGQSWAPIPALAHVIRITRSLNTGAAFGIFPMASNVFQVLALITVAVFLWMYPRLPDRAWLSQVAIGLIAGGALSNAIDRLRFDHVIDFVHVQLTPTFANISNFADHAITVGVVLLIVDQWMEERRQAAEEAAAEEAAAAMDAAEDEEPGAEMAELPASDVSSAVEGGIEQIAGHD